MLEEVIGIFFLCLFGVLVIAAVLYVLFTKRKRNYRDSIIANAHNINTSNYASEILNNVESMNIDYLGMSKVNVYGDN